MGAVAVGCGAKSTQALTDAGASPLVEGEAAASTPAHAQTDDNSGGSSDDPPVEPVQTPALAPCAAPQPLTNSVGQPTGFVECASGLVYRSVKADCDPGTVSEAARYQCLGDDDCSQGQICLCNASSSSCVPASCTSDDVCSPGAKCATIKIVTDCWTDIGFQCQSPEDSCVVDQDCGDAECVTLSGEPRHCELVGDLPFCGVVDGRPFLVGAQVRTATLASGRDWRAELGTEDLRRLTNTQRQALANHWQRAALMEHASIAAFARFALQLLSLGAPATFLERTHSALQDETAHAKLAFALASRYAGRDVGPGPLSLQDVLLEQSLEAILITTLQEGCIGETLAALEAAEALQHATDPAVREVLARVARDELQHAELAWAFVRWALRGTSDLLRLHCAATLRAVMTQLESPVVGNVPEADVLPLLEHGVLSPEMRTQLRQQAVREVLRPCIRELFVALDAAA
jgi:hypothetical protein